MKERFGLDPKDGKSEGILADNPEDCIFWFSDGAYFDPSSPQCIFLVGDAYNLWNRTDGGVWGSQLIAGSLDVLWLLNFSILFYFTPQKDAL